MQAVITTAVAALHQQAVLHSAPVCSYKDEYLEKSKYDTILNINLSYETRDAV